MSAFVIEKGIPIPGARETKRIYPYQEMEVGDSFAVEDIEPQTYGRVASSISAQLKSKNGRKYAMRRIRAEQVIRVWRVA